MDALFGGKKPQGPSDAEKAAQRDQQNQAQQSNAETDQKLALATRASSLRRALAYNGTDKKQNLGA